MIQLSENDSQEEIDKTPKIEFYLNYFFKKAGGEKF